jgi:hypothetical protein
MEADDGTVEFFVALLFETIGIKPEATCRQYAEGLVEQGACREDLEEATAQSLQEDYGWKPLHAKRVDKWRAKQQAVTTGEGGGAAPPAAATGAGEGNPDEPPPPHESVTPAAARPGGAQVMDLPNGSNLRVGALIGRGGSATVHKARWVEHGRERHVAVKRLATGATEKELIKFEKELNLITLAAKRCDFVCRVHGAFCHEGEMVLVMKEYVEDLTRLIAREGALPIARALRYADQVCRGLVSLHDEHITVFDLKPANILIDESDQIAISDFGISKLQGTWTATAIKTAWSNSVSRVGGTPQYQSPEQYDPEEYGQPATPADIWAFGCVLLSLLTGDSPWPAFSGASQDRQIMTAILVKKRSPEIPSGIPPEVADIMRRCLTLNPKGRPSAAQVLTMLASASASAAAMARVSCPLGASGKHIFLSYRRVDSHLAATVKHALEQLGYIVFFDMSQTSGLGAGDFTVQLEKALRETPVFVCLLTGTTNAASGEPEFLRIKQPGDVVRLEIRAALAMNKVVIPFHTSDFDIAKMVNQQDLPPDVVALGKQNFVRHDVHYFDAAIARIHTFVEAEAVAGRLADLVTYAGDLPPEPVAMDDPNRPTKRTQCTEGMQAYAYADSIIQSSWAKRDLYEFERLVQVEEIDNPRLSARFEAYKTALSEGNRNEQLVFHGCSSESLHSIIESGFRQEYWKTAAGDWQRFGPGFYFALQASKSHEYPLGEMQALLSGATYTKSMLLCRIAKGNCLQTASNMDHLTGTAPEGFHSIHGVATPGGPLNFDELVVFDEAAILPYAVVSYQYRKVPLAPASAAVTGGGAGGFQPTVDPITVSDRDPELGNSGPFGFLEHAAAVEPEPEAQQPQTSGSAFAFIDGGEARATAPAGDVVGASPVPEPATAMSTADSLLSFHATLASLQSTGSSSLDGMVIGSSSVDLLGSPAPNQVQGNLGMPLQLEAQASSDSPGGGAAAAVAGGLMDMFTPPSSATRAGATEPPAHTPTPVPDTPDRYWIPQPAMRLSGSATTSESSPAVAVTAAPVTAAAPAAPLQQQIEMDPVTAYLSSLGLGAYAAKMIADGYDDVEDLQALSRDDLESICNPFLKKVTPTYRESEEGGGGSDADAVVGGGGGGGEWLSGGAGTFSQAQATAGSAVAGGGGDGSPRPSSRSSRLLFDPAAQGSGGGGAAKQYVVTPDNCYMRNTKDRSQLFPGTVYMSANNLSFRSDRVRRGATINAKCPRSQVVQVTKPQSCVVPADTPLQAEVVDYREMATIEVTFIASVALKQQLLLMKKSEEKVVVVQYVLAMHTANQIYEALAAPLGLSASGGAGGGAAAAAGGVSVPTAAGLRRSQRAVSGGVHVDVVGGVVYAAPSRMSMNR